MANIDGHDSRGRFTSGNPGGRGRRIDALKKALENAVTAEDIQDIAEALKEKAKDGDIKAAELIFNRLFGKPAQNRAAAEPLELDYIIYDDDKPEPEGDGADGLSFDMEAFKAQLKAGRERVEAQRAAQQGQ